MPKISIVTPVYNTQKYLKKCLDSIQNQTFTDFEVILIDDGSSDTSPQILDDFAKNDSRFKVFHKKNEGVTQARKDGLSHATGEYIIWVDSDDWIEQNHLELLYNGITKEQADICVSNFVKDEVSGTVKYFEKIDDLKNPLKSLIEEDSCRGCLWTKISKRTLYTEQDIFPPEGINCWEDKIITANLYYYSKKTVHIPVFTYHVNDLNETSLTRHTTNALKNAQDRINVAKYFDSDFRFPNIDMTVQKLDIKYTILIDSYIAQKIIPKDFWNLFPEAKGVKKILKTLKKENVHFGCRFIEIFLILSNLKFLAAPLHYLMAIYRTKQK